LLVVVVVGIPEGAILGLADGADDALESLHRTTPLCIRVRE
jgi:hypothetical protein